jgi:glycosyltransferase involved in cell wall biosynthesis
MRVGVLPAVGNGLIHMKRTGQLARLHAHLRAYGGRCTYFSYASISEDKNLWDWDLGHLNAPQDAPRNLFRYALTRPIVQRGAFQECDVLRCTSLLGAIPAIVAKAMYGIPFIFSHGADYIRIAQIHGRSRLHIQKWRALRAVAMRMADAVIVQNSSMAVQLQGEYPHARVRFIPNWVDTDLFAPGPRSLPGARPMVLYVGRLVEEKNLEVLARACRAAGAVLVCAGEGPLANALRDLKAEVLGAVPWTGLSALHRTADVFAMVSHTEGHCKALTEAMASGLPCVVSKAVTEGMEPGRNCLQVDPTETSITLALEVLAADPAFAAALGAGARETAVQLWSKETILGQELRLLRDAAR